MVTKYPIGIRPHGAGLEIRIQYKNRHYSETIKCARPDSESSIARAIRARNDLRRRLRQGTDKPSPDADGSISFADAAQGYINTLDVEFSTATSYLSILNTHWLPIFEGWTLRDIRPSQIRSYVQGANLSPKTRRNLLVPIRGLFIWAIEEGMINTSPVLQVRSRKTQKPKIEVFTPEERDRILSHLTGQAFVYFALLFGTGMRTGEALALQWDNVSEDSAYVASSVVRGRLKATTKTHQARTVYLEPWLRQILREHPTRFTGGFVFINEFGERYTSARRFNGAWQSALHQAGVPYRIPYTCRHSRASELLTLGVKPGFAATQLGHTLEMFFRTYAHWISEQDDKTEIGKLRSNWEKYGVIR